MAAFVYAVREKEQPISVNCVDRALRQFTADARETAKNSVQVLRGRVDVDKFCSGPWDAIASQWDDARPLKKQLVAQYNSTLARSMECVPLAEHETPVAG